MKKILLVLIVLISLFVIPDFKVKAIENSFYEGEYISGEYIKKFKPGSATGKYEQLRFFRRNGDNLPVYCIQLWETLSSGKNLIGYDTNPSNYAGLDMNTWQQVVLTAYYGYGYQNHTDNKWYAITQFMIWKITSPDSNIYFTDTLNGNRMNKYEAEMQEINLLISNHNIVPSFNNQTFSVIYNQEYTITDTNNVINQFRVFDTELSTFYISGNRLTIEQDISGDSQILLRKSAKKYSYNPIVYIDNDGQNILLPGNFDPINAAVYFHLPSVNVVVNKLDQETNLNQPQGDAQLSGSKFQLLDQHNRILQEKIVQHDGSAIFENVGYGYYKIREVEPGTGYLLNNQVIDVSVNESIQPIYFANRVMKNDIIFHKYIRNPLTGVVDIEENATFLVYGSNGNVVTQFQTDYNGTYQLTLPYGIYFVKQISGKKNHYYVDDFKIVVNTDNQVQTINLYNEELTAKVRVINTDSISNLPLLESGAKFQIKNIDTNEYVSDSNNKPFILTTNDLGKTGFLILSAGSYQVEQISVIKDYVINKEIFSFQIQDTVDFMIDEANEKYLEIIVPNDRKTTQIEVNKIVEYYLDDELIKRKKENNINIPIYAKEDIFSKDGQLLYHQDEEVGMISLIDEKLISQDLFFGNYYIKNPIDGSIFDIVLNTTDTKEIDFVFQIYEYTKSEDSTIEKEEINHQIPNISIPELKEEEFTEMLNSKKDDIKIQITISEKKKNQSLDQLPQEEIMVPNTYIEQPIYPNIGYIFMLLGLFLIRKSHSYEK